MMAYWNGKEFEQDHSKAIRFRSQELAWDRLNKNKIPRPAMVEVCHQCRGASHIIKSDKSEK